MPDLENFWTDRDLHYGRFRAEHVEAFVAEEAGALARIELSPRAGAASAFSGRCRSRLDRWNGGAAQPLVAAACDAFERWGVSHAGLFTFAESPKHVHLYGKFGFYPRFLTALMIGADPARRPAGRRLALFGSVPDGARHG